MRVLVNTVNDCLDIVVKFIMKLSYPFATPFSMESIGNVMHERNAHVVIGMQYIYSSSA